MTKIVNLIFTLLIIGSFNPALILSDALTQTQITGNIPVYEITERGNVGEWIIAGPFPDDPFQIESQDSSFLRGFRTDFLVSINGEENAVLQDQTRIEFEGKDREKSHVNSKYIQANELNIINFIKIFGQLDHQVAYAFCYLKSDRDQMVHILMGSDDANKVWINGKLVHENFTARGLGKDDDLFSVNLRKGLNTMLVKISQLVRGWAFIVEILDDSGYETYQRKKEARLDIDSFLRKGLVPVKTNRWNYFFTPGPLPELAWSDKYLVKKVAGEFPLTVRWFDKNLNEVQEAAFPGRYGYYAEGRTEEGILIRRSGTLYCMPSDWVAWGERLKASLAYFPLPGSDKMKWLTHQEAIADFAGRIILLSVLDQNEGAILMSYVDEIQEKDKSIHLFDTPIIQDHEYHLALKNKILGINGTDSPLVLPKNSDHAAPVLKSGGEMEAGFKAGTAEKIRALCEEWCQKSGEPFQILIARHGVYIIREAFNVHEQYDYDRDTPTEMASITKMLTGLLFAQFVDQGLINLDDPVGKYLPDFPTEGEKAITLRHCFTHTSGLWGHEEWGGMHDPWLDNKIYSLLDYLPVGRVHEYNGMGYDLAGKVMEIVSHKSIFRLFKENFFEPLDLKHTVLEEDLAFSCFSTVEDFSKFGQLLLNKGSYGHKVFFSEETFEKLLPQPLDQFYPGIDVEWGIGLTWMRQKHPDAGQNGLAADHTILSKNIIGHGSATSAILRADLDNDLLICQTRRNGGKYYEEYLQRLLLVIEKGLKN